MRYSVVLSDQAEKDIRNIYEYIAFEKPSPSNAAGLIDRLEEQISKLDEMPYRFREYDREPWKTRGLRIMPIENYVACYIPNENDAEVTVIRFFYDGQNIKEHLEKTDI